ncbi:hypothetical protein FB451DRAFT_1401572 [Mycena latifolia]|nr:hypothetical protein FB451DRAFT_1401572 [Mycena latifolia]
MDPHSPLVLATPPPFHIVEFSGPVLLADVLHWGLFGALTVQLYLYYEAFPHDRLPTKCLVYGVYAIELVETILITHDAFASFGYGFGSLAALTRIDFDWLDIPIMSGLVAFLGQSFYAYRVYVLSKSLFVPVLILIVSLTSSVGAFLTGAFILEAGNLALLNNRKISAAAGVWCGASALCDIIIAVGMTYYVSFLFSSLLILSDLELLLELSKKITGFRQTQALVSKVIRLTLETGSLTALVAVTNLTLFFAFPGRAYYVTAAGVLPTLYANCILVVLNARCQILGGRATYASSTDFSSTSSYLRNVGTHAASANDTHPVMTHREVLSDTAMYDRVQMKSMGINARDVGTCV